MTQPHRQEARGHGARRPYAEATAHAPVDALRAGPGPGETRTRTGEDRTGTGPTGRSRTDENRTDESRTDENPTGGERQGGRYAGGGYAGGERTSTTENGSPWSPDGPLGADALPARPPGRFGRRGETHVWWWRTPERVDPEDLALLSTEEFRRALGLLAERHAAAFVHTRAQARRGLAALLDVSPTEITLGRLRCPGCGAADHGPPALTDPPLPLSVSLSRTAGWAVFAASVCDRLGVDAEELRPVGAAVLDGAVLTAGERAHLRERPPGPARDAAFHRVWTRKEAVVKATGRGLTGIDLGRLDTLPDHPGPVRVRYEHPSAPSEWTVRDLRLSDRLAVALARPPHEGGQEPPYFHAPPPTAPAEHSGTDVTPYGPDPSHGRTPKP